MKRARSADNHKHHAPKVKSTTRTKARKVPSYKSKLKSRHMKKG